MRNIRRYFAPAAAVPRPQFRFFSMVLNIKFCFFFGTIPICLFWWLCVLKLHYKAASMRPRRARSSHREEKYFHFSFHARTDSFGLLLSHVDILPIKTRRKCLIRNSLVLTGRVSSQMVTQIILSFDILCGSKGFCATAKTDPESMISFPFACSFGVFFLSFHPK